MIKNKKGDIDILDIIKIAAVIIVLYILLQALEVI